MSEISDTVSATRLFRLMLYGEVSSEDYAKALQREVRERRERENARSVREMRGPRAPKRLGFLP